MTKKPVDNIGFSSFRLTCNRGALCFYSSLVMVDNFVLRNLPGRNPKTP